MIERLPAVLDKKSFILSIFVVLCLLRVVFIFVSPLRGDEKEYAAIAETIKFSGEDRSLPWEDKLVKHPLLAVYGIKASVSVFGNTRVGQRFFAFLAGCLSLLIFYFFLKKYISYEAGLVGLFLLGCNIFHISASIANSLAMFFGISAIYLFWKSMEESKLWPALGCGVVLGLGYLNKEIVAGVFVCFFIYGCFLNKNKKRLFINLSIALASFIAILLPYFTYVSAHGSISRLLDKNYMLDFKPNLSGVDFYLARLRGYLLGVDPGTLLSWEHYPMEMISGIVLAAGTFIGMLRVKGDLAQFMGVIFTFFILLISCLNRAEHTWAQITIFPAVYFTSAVLAGWSRKSPFYFYLTAGLVICLMISAFLFLQHSRTLVPPNRLAAIVDYDTDLIHWYYENGRWDDALKEAEEALDVCPNEVRVLNLLGVIHAAKGNTDKAGVYFQKALANKNDFYPARVNISLLNRDRSSHTTEQNFMTK